MKVRNDFVTNSSSSSYVIAYKDMADFDEETLRKYPVLNNLKNLVHTLLYAEYDDTYNRETLKTVDDMDKYFLGNFCSDSLDQLFEDEPGLKDLYDKMKTYIEDGYTILDKGVSYDEFIYANILKIFENADNDSPIVLIDCD